MSSRRMSRALAVPQQAISLAKPGDYVRVFLDEGEAIADFEPERHGGQLKRGGRRWCVVWSCGAVGLMAPERRVGTGLGGGAALAGVTTRLNQILLLPIIDRRPLHWLSTGGRRSLLLLGYPIG